jgi:hypothetical protein
MMGGGAGFMGSSAGGYGSTASSSTAARRVPTYSAILGFSNASPVSSGLQNNLQQMLSQSAALPSNRNIQIAMDGSTVVLQGWTADDHERRLAEGMVRLTPGVHDVRNELQVANFGPQRSAATPQSTRP